MRRLLTVATLIGLGQACSPVGLTSGSPTVQIRNSAFVPAQLTVKAGDSVTFTNTDSGTHSAMATNKTFDTGSLAAGESKVIKFEKTGTVAYTCTFHPNESGAIDVR